VLRTELRGLAIWDGRPSNLRGGAASLVRIWQAQHFHMDEVHVPEQRGERQPTPAVPAVAVPEESAPAGFEHDIRAMLFADVVGYRALSEDETPHFVTQFLGAVADLNAKTRNRPEHVETSGDGLYMVFGTVRDAGLYAMQLNQLVTATDWAARGLPRGLNIRIALHCGPVYCGRNPVTGAPLYTGPHTSRTARIEPITPPGQVYASSAFAAVAATMGVEGLDMQYVGRMPLAKGYGLLSLYHVHPAVEPAGGDVNPRGCASAAR
jgi:class 3 adenylate cyclase